MLKLPLLIYSSTELAYPCTEYFLLVKLHYQRAYICPKRETLHLQLEAAIAICETRIHEKIWRKNMEIWQTLHFLMCVFSSVLLISSIGNAYNHIVHGNILSNMLISKKLVMYFLRDVEYLEKYNDHSTMPTKYKT